MIQQTNLLLMKKNSMNANRLSNKQGTSLLSVSIQDFKRTFQGSLWENAINIMELLGNSVCSMCVFTDILEWLDRERNQNANGGNFDTFVESVLKFNSMTVSGFLILSVYN